MVKLQVASFQRISQITVIQPENFGHEEAEDWEGDFDDCDFEE
jgi:hypothetical protein